METVWQDGTICRVFLYYMRPFTGSGEVRQVSPHSLSRAGQVLSAPRVTKFIIPWDSEENSRLRPAVTCFSRLFSVKTGDQHVLQEMDVTGAGALRSTISRPSENGDGIRERS